MHNGSAATLEKMIDLLSDGMPQQGGQQVSGTISPHIKVLALSAAEKQSLIAFLKALND